MRRVLGVSSATGLTSITAACTQRRTLRKRRGVGSEDNSSHYTTTSQSPLQHSISDVSTHSATTDEAGVNILSSSLDRIRAELCAMQEAAQDTHPFINTRHQQSNKDGKNNTNSETSALTKTQISAAELDKELLTSLQQRHRPHEAYYRGTEIDSAMAIRQARHKRQLYYETEEVIRRRNKSDIAHYCRLAFPDWPTENTETQDKDNNKGAATGPAVTTAAVLQRARALRERVEAEVATIERERQDIAKENEATQEDTTTTNNIKDSDTTVVVNDDEYVLVRELAWVRVLDSLTSAELRQLWQDGVVDYDVLESLTNTTTTTTLKSEAATEEAEEEEEEEERGYILDDKMAALEKLEYVAALTRELYENTLQNVPSLDLAPTLEKIRQGNYSDISASELKQLEAYEERPVVLGPTNTTTSNSNSEKDVPVHQVKMTEALLNQALLPSNRLLHAVARHDATVRDALDALEKIKRATLLDGTFQDALQVAAAMEGPLEDTVRHHVGRPSLRTIADAADLKGNNDEEEDTEKQKEGKTHSTRGRSHRRTTTNMSDSSNIAAWRGRPARPYHAADIPYFFHSMYSRVPPQADFNLPAPALNPQEKAALRGQRRRLRGPARFSRFSIAMSMEDRSEMDEALASLRDTVLRNNMKNSTTNAEYSPEQHLVAAASKLRKLDSSNQAAMDNLFNALSSPFKIGSKLCEDQRAAVLQCYSSLIRPPTQNTTTTASSTTGGSSSESKAVRDVVLSAEMVLELPLYKCCEAATRYERCVEEKVVARHLELAKTFHADAEKQL